MGCPGLQADHYCTRARGIPSDLAYFDLERLGQCLGDSAHPYKFAQEGLFGSLPSRFTFLL
jgi:hypothetical protein